MAPNLKRLEELLTQSVDLLGEAITQMKEIELDRRKEAIDQLIAAIGSVFYARSFIPDLNINDEIPEPDGPLTPEQSDLVSKLTVEQIRFIDNLLMAQTHVQWRKVARIVGFAMMHDPDRFRGIPDIYYSQRVKHLVEVGLLESQGNLEYMRYGEVRLPTNDDSDQQIAN